MVLWVTLGAAMEEGVVALGSALEVPDRTFASEP